MASLLRQIIAGPRARHPEAGLDLCYVTDNIIATSGPSQTYPQLAYRNPLDQLVTFLDSKHGDDWAIWEFRAEGTGYPDDAVYNRIRHYPFPDHHPPPFRLMPMIMASMRNWLHGGDLGEGGALHEGHVSTSPNTTTGNSTSDATTEEKRKKRVVVVHCKAGKGRSGTASCSYLIAEEGWKAEDALARFTERRMRPRFGAGVSIPSQLRWISYVDRWTQGGKKYLERPIEIVEIHVWGLRSGVRVDVEGFADEGKRIEVLHTFKKEERVVVDATRPEETSISDVIWEMAGYAANRPKQEAPDEADFADSTNPNKEETKTVEDSKDQDKTKAKALTHAKSIKRKGTALLHKVTTPDTKQLADKNKSRLDAVASTSSSRTDVTDSSDPEPGGMAVILKPTQPIRIPHSDVNISVERRNKTPKSMGLTMVTAVAHVWFNAFFEGQGPEQDGRPSNSGVFGIEWEAMDGIKGSSRKGSRAMDRIAVVWRVPGTGSAEEEQGEVVMEPAEGQPVPQMKAADWGGANKDDLDKNLGLRVQSNHSVDVSKASSMKSEDGDETAKQPQDEDGGSIEGVKSSGPMGEDLKPDDEGSEGLEKDGTETKQDSELKVGEKGPGTQDKS
ncbi:hypothetical protein BGZ61DRAFT_394665 [Ilyonectria robusta]|uniref:uncharacterized protein n=1 Tax=Ilyonectria robusta TaxID=1079257 RepID=UPI001E8E134B|nr:uncharacterized protein BGZ61DRAFT_394665 [Ilyonectria robusta]KAH8683405.1 hypothetical protein BGZ61DRAFT_394665 [Ilyonectria robusta]